MQGRTGPDHASRYAADTHDIESFAHAEQQLARLRTPVFMAASDPHARLYVASFDGTGNDREQPGPRTNPALIYNQIQADPMAHPRVQGGYIAGPGTQAHAPERWNDLKSGITYQARLEEMYLVFCRQAWRWIRDNPEATIGLVNVGFSRGGEEAAGFARLVDERGIRDPTNVRIHRNRDQLITRIDYDPTLPFLRAPGSVAQAELLFDPVGTGEPWKRDRRPPPRVLTGLQIYAEDERRDLFKPSHILAPGLSSDARFLGVVVGGAHSNIGGGNVEDGLSRRSLNLGIDFLNSLSNTPFLEKVHLRPDLDVVVRTAEYLPIYNDRAYRAKERAGVPEDHRRAGIECIAGSLRRCDADGRSPAPVDRVLNAAFPRRDVPIGRVPPTPDKFLDRPPAQQRDDLQPVAPPRGLLHRIIAPGVGAIEDIKEKLLSQAEAGVRSLDASLGRDYDASSERMAASLARLAKAEGFDRIDAVMLGRPTETVRAGEHVFVVQGRFPDATNRVAHMKTQDAIATPVEHSMRQMEQLDASRHALAGVPGQTQGPPLAHRLRA
ncbi:MAG: hypothetical protein EPO46_02355 [Lysobacter sp.]|nr:MAG: hypothetical protein EPO46_02355 [Lysobacter sp.]